MSESPLRAGLLLGVGAVAVAIGLTRLATPSVDTDAAARSFEARGPLRIPRRFAREIESTTDDAFGGSFTPDGRTLYLSRSDPYSRRSTILESQFSHGRWRPPEIAPFSGRYSDSHPVLAPDGSRLYWSSNRPVNGEAGRVRRIWMVGRTAGGEWSAPVPLPPPIASGGSEFCASVARDGTLYFTSSRDGGDAGMVHVYRSREIDGRWTRPEDVTRLMDGSDTTDAYDRDVAVDPDQRFLVLGSAGRPEGSGHFDLYVSWNRGGRWSRPFHPGAPINTAALDSAPFLSPDGRYLFFSSGRGAGRDAPPAAVTFREPGASPPRALDAGVGIYQVDFALLDSMAAARR